MDESTGGYLQEVPAKRNIIPVLSIRDARILLKTAIPNAEFWGLRPPECRQLRTIEDAIEFFGDDNEGGR